MMKRGWKRTEVRRWVLPGLLLAGVQMLVVAKHPAPRYYLPAMPLLAIALVTLQGPESFHISLSIEP